MAAFPLFLAAPIADPIRRAVKLREAPIAVVTIFARAPVEGRVKTRLAEAIGAGAALDFYRACLEGLVGRLAGSDAWRLQIAVTPDRAIDDRFFTSLDAELVAQGPGDLGARMMRVLSQAAPRRPTVIVGSDVPDLAAEHIQAALAALASHDLVIGPSPDGGYWLIAASRPPPAGLFADVRWSSAHARADTLANIGGGSVAMLDWLEDVDDGASYLRSIARRP